MMTTIEILAEGESESEEFKPFCPPIMIKLLIILIQLMLWVLTNNKLYNKATCFNPLDGDIFV